MTVAIIKHKVQDFATWKPSFAEHGATRQAAGCRGSRVLQSVADPNEVVIILEWDSAENFQSFADSSQLREVMEKAGVLGPPEILILNDGESFPD